MDTSTISFTQKLKASLPQTSSLNVELPEPPAQWFTRLISPLTSHRRIADPPTSTPIHTHTPETKQTVDLEDDNIMLEKQDWYEEYQEIEFQDNIDSVIRDVGEGPSSSQQLWHEPPSYMTEEGRVFLMKAPEDNFFDNEARHSGGMSPIFLVLIPVLVVVLTVLVGIVCFLLAMLVMRKRRGIMLLEDGGPLDLSKSDGVIGEGGTDGVESRWLETVDPDIAEGYKRAKDWQEQYQPASSPTDITLTQFLSIQEKGVSAWAFEPDYEDNLSLYVQSRTEITFLSDGPGMPSREGGGNSVMANLPIPKLNEVYYFEVKLYEKPPTTEVAIGLATKPYPSFRLPGWNRFSVAYFASDGFKSHNYPFTAASHGQPLNEGDVLGVGYRPRTGTVFFTRNGRKMEDAYTGLQRFNLFPTIGANGPCTIHVNLGQAGFVFIEAQVKKWGLAPMVGTLAPPPAYGSERGSILLDAGYGTPGANSPHLEGSAMESARRSPNQFGSSVASSSSHQPSIRSNSSRRHRTAGRAANLPGSVPAISSPLRGGAERRGSASGGPGPTTAGTRRRILGAGNSGGAVESNSATSYVSPTDTPAIGPRIPSSDALENLLSEDEGSQDENGARRGGRRGSYVESDSDSSAMEPNPPTPNLLDISMHSLHHPGQYFDGRFDGSDEEDDEETEGTEGEGSGESDETARPGPVRPERPRIVMGQQQPGDSPPPPGYAPLDPNVYRNGLPHNLPDEMVDQAFAAMSEAEHRDEIQATDSARTSTDQEQGNGGRFGWIFGRG